jgi:hypothetical protein
MTIDDLIRRAQAPETPNRFLVLLEERAVPRERLNWLAGEQFHVLRSDRRSFATLAARFPDAPAGPMFLSLAAGENQALELLRQFTAALDFDPVRYEPRPGAQAYPSYLAWCALQCTLSGVALAMLSNLEEWGGYCRRVADALVGRYDIPEAAVGFFRFFGETPPGFADTARAAIAHGLATGEDPDEARRAARLLHHYESMFWETLADGITT